MTTDTTSQKKNTDTQNVFRPLGKYAFIAIIMVSMIVTTAIMLNKQQSSTGQEVAKMENNFAEISTAELAATATDSTETTQSMVATEIVKTASAPEAEAVVETTVETKAQEEVQAEVQAVVTETAKETTEQTAAEAATEAATTIAVVNEIETAAEAASSRAAEQTSPSMAAADADNAIQSDRQQRTQAIKAMQRQRLTEMFTRIEALEAQRLDQYKARQDKQIERLRGQIARQQQLIDDLITRNKDRFDMRAAKVQQQQSSRKDMLNRI